MRNFFYISVLLILFNNIINAGTVCYQVAEGWNLIGSPCDGDISSVVTTTPPGIISASWFKFVPGSGYVIATTLTVAEGYWVQVSEAGEICFTCDCEDLPNCGTVEYDGKIYNTIYIGLQCWLRENLAIGTQIPIGTPQTNNGGTNIIEKYCYDDGYLYCRFGGGLYQWDEAMQYSTTPGAQGICPDDWHIPTLAEFQTLSSNVLGDGNVLKALGFGTGLGEGTNESGFTALLAGYSESGSFIGFLSHAGFWSSLGSGSTASYMGLFVSNSTIFGLTGQLIPKSNGYSVRCLRDPL